MCLCTFYEMVVLCLVPFVKACCLSVQLYILILQHFCRPLITLPSMQRCILIFRCSSRRPTHAISGSWSMHYRYRLCLLPSFRTPVPVRLVCVFTVCSSSFIIHAPLLPGHVQP